ncbi:plexin-B, partial [Brachionus plicatilis]
TMNYLKQIVLLLVLVEWSRGIDDERAPAHISLDQIDSVFLASISSRADYTSDTAVHPTKIQNAQNIAYHNHYVYIGAQNWLLKLNAHTLKIEQSVRYGPLHDSAFCRYSPVDECMPGHTKSLVDNHNKLLLVYAQQNALLSCWSGRQGICDVRALDDLGRLILNSSIAAVANDPANSTVGFIASSANSQPVLYIAATYSNNGAYRADVPALSGRSLNLQPSRFMHIIGSDSHGLKSSKASIEFMSRFAKTFIVKYVHAFNLGVYNYFLTVQHADTDAMLRADRLVSKVARLCLNDLSFAKSYTEMPVKCVGVRANVDYNEMISAKHALVNGEHYLIGLFQQTARNSFNASIHKSPWTNQAVCMYKMSAVQRQFRHNINKCYSSEVMRGLNFIKPDQKCMAKRQVAERVDDDFCSSAENGLYPIGGTVPVVASAVLEFTDRLYDSVAVFEHELTNSLILKSADTLDLYDMNTMRVYRSVKVAYEKAPVVSANDVWVEEREGVVYALSGGGTRLVKIDMFDCDRLTSCGQCVGESVRAQIYCGWCATSGRCSARVHCPSGGKWLSGAQMNVSEWELADVCVDIESVEPRVIHADLLPWIHVHFGNEMSVRDHHLNYSCVFVSEMKSEMETRAVWMDSSRLKCAMPHVSLIERVLINERAESDGEMELADDGIFEVVPTRVSRVELGVYVKNSDEFKYGWSKSRSTALFNITVIHCGMYRSCISCVSDECSWCDNKCVSTANKDDQTISQCVNQSQMCSSFDPATNKLLIPYTAHRPQAPLTFRLKNPPHQLIRNYVCHITMAHGSPLTQPISVPLTVLNKTHSSCTLTNIFTYVDPLLTNGQVQTDLRVYTGDYYIDSPSNGKLTLLFYKCEQKANDCSSCLSINRQLSCMWCGAVGSCKFMNAQSKLAALSECVGAWSNSALVPLNQCQKPHIESISPVKVPYSGGSLLTINGANLGSSFDDVISVTLICTASVTTSTQCDLIRSGYTASKKIVCKLAAFTKSNEQCSVNVRLKTSNGQPSVLVRASQLVRLVDPVITSVEPAHVIQSAGFVWLTVNGVDLDSGRSRQLDIVDNVNDFEQRVVKCEIKNVTEHTVRCRLSDKFSTLGKKNVRLIIDEYTSINSHLKVNSDPLVKSIDHWTSFYGGGAAFQLTGFNFDSVQSAYTFVNYGDMWYSEPVSATSRLSNEKIVFESPALSDAFFAIAKSTNGPPRSHYLLQVGFLMDGFNVTLNEQRITYVPNLPPASLQTQALHLIKSNDLYTIKLTVAMATDNQHVDLIKRNFQVYIGCSLCDHGKWTDNQHYTCTLPQLVYNKSRDLYQCKPKVYRALLEQLNSPAGSLRMFNMFVANSWFEMGRHGDTNIDLYTQSYQLNNVHNFIQVVERLAQEPMVDGSERSVSVLQQILHKHEQFRRESSKSALITPGLITNKNLFILSGIIASVVLILILITLSLGSVVLKLKRNSSPAYKLGCRGRQRHQRTRRHGRLHLEHIQKQMDQLELSIRPQCSHLYQQLHNDYLNELNNDLVYSLTALPLYNYKTYLYSCIFARSPNLDLIYSPLNVAMSSSMSMSNSTTNTLLSHTHTSLQKTNMSVYATIKSSSMLHSADQDTNTNTNSSKQQQFGSYGPIGEAMLLFDQLMHNKTFVSTFVEVCESHKDSFGLKEKHNFSALITLALKDNLHYLCTR